MKSEILTEIVGSPIYTMFGDVYVVFQVNENGKGIFTVKINDYVFEDENYLSLMKKLDVEGILFRWGPIFKEGRG